MNALLDFCKDISQKVGDYLPTLLGALLILLVGRLAAGLCRSGVAALLKRLKLDQRLQSDPEHPVLVEQLISNLVYYLLILYVLILALDVLGIRDVLEPVKVMFTNVMSAIPNIVAAGLIGFVGYVIARLISEPVRALTSGIDKYAPKLGLGESFRLSRLLGQLVFIAIFLPVLIAALDALKVEAISVPATGMLTSLLNAIPMIIGAAIILAVAYIAGTFVTNVLRELLENLGADDLPGKIGVENLFKGTFTFSRCVAKLVLFFIMLGASISAIEKLELSQISLILNELLIFSGHIVLGLAILGVGSLVANAACAALKHSGAGEGVAAVTRFAVLGLVLAMGLKAMGIADEIVHLAFGLTAGAVAVAVALSFGIGGREAAGKHMDYMLAKLRQDTPNDSDT